MRAYFLTKKGVIAVLRWLLFFVVAYLVTTSEVGSFPLFVLLLIFFALSNIILGLVSEDSFRRWRLNYGVVLFDVLFISAAIYLTGDLDLYIFYFFTIIMAAYGRQIRGSFLVAVLVSFFYLWVVIRQGGLQVLFSPGILIRIPFFYLVAMISSFMAEESKLEQEKLVRTQVILGMTQELGLARDRKSLLEVLRSTLRRFPKVLDARVYFFRPAPGDYVLAGKEELLKAVNLSWKGEELGLSRGYTPADGKTFLVKNIPTNTQGKESPHSPGARSMAIVPFTLRGGECGLLAVYSTQLEGFGEGDLETFEISALSLARGLDNLAAFQEIQDRARELSSLMEVSQVINSSLVLREVLQRVMDQSSRTLGVEASSLMLIEESTRELVFEVATGAKEEEVKQFRLKVGEGVAGWVAREGEPLIVNDVQADSRFFARVDWRTGFVTRSLMAVPLKVRERVIGVLEVVNKIAPGPFNEKDLRLLQALADQAGIAVEKARLYKYMEEQVNETIEMYLSLEKEKSRVDTILASMIEAVIVADERGEVALVNEPARRTFATDDGKWLPEYKRVIDLLRRVLREKHDLTKEISVEVPERRIFNVRVAPIITAAGKILGAVAVLEDVTEITRLSEMKSEFISQVSHELRTPLTSIRGAMNLLLRRKAGTLTRKQSELASLVQEETTHMTTMINDLLDLSKLESGLIRMEPEVIEVRPLLERLIEGLSVLIAEKNLQLEWELSPNLGPIFVDRKRIKVVFTNLVGNAVKYTSQGGTITLGGEVEMEKRGDPGGTPMARLWVRDSGVGIPEEDQKWIFEKFQRGRTEGVDGIPGTGLGLAIAREIVEEHGGRIWVESRVGRGSSFFFTVPLVRARARFGGRGNSKGDRT